MLGVKSCVVFNKAVCKVLGLSILNENLNKILLLFADFKRYFKKWKNKKHIDDQKVNQLKEIIFVFIRGKKWTWNQINTRSWTLQRIVNKRLNNDFKLDICSETQTHLLEKLLTFIYFKLTSIGTQNETKCFFYSKKQVSTFRQIFDFNWKMKDVWCR